MAGVSDYAAISARVRAMYAELLTPQDMVRLSEATDFSSLFTVLKSTSYGPYLDGLKDKDINPKRVITQIKRKLSDAFYSVIQMSPVQTRPLVKQLYRYYEIGNLKAVLRGIVTVSAGVLKQPFGTGSGMCFSPWVRHPCCPRRR